MKAGKRISKGQKGKDYMTWIQIIVIASFLTTGCGLFQKKKNQYLTTHLSNKHLHEACELHKKEVLVPAIKESQNPDLDDETYYFVRHEAKALEFINKFDINKFTMKENGTEYQEMVHECVFEKSKEHKPCDTLLPAYKYFRGLIHGMNQYRWSSPTLEKAKQNTISYIQLSAESRSSFMELLLANDLLKRLAERSYIPKSHLTFSYSFRKEAESSYERLKKEVRKLQKKDFSCKIAVKFYESEKEEVQKLADKLIAQVKDLK
jgi:hypothetical protein